MVKILKNRYVLILLLVTFISLQYVEQHHILNVIFNYGRIIASGIIVVIYFFSKTKFSMITIAISLVQIVFIFSTIMNNGNIVSCFNFSISIIMLCMLIELCMYTDVLCLLDSLITIMAIITTINFVTVIMAPKGYYAPNLWFIGGRNTGFGTTIFPYMTFLMLKSHFLYEKMNASVIFFMILNTVSIVIVWSAGNIVGAMMFMFFIFFLYKKNNYKITNYISYVLFNIIYFFGIIIFRFQNYIAFVIVDLLKRDLTFSYRTLIWDRVLEWIALRSIIGNGIEYVEISRSKILFESTHNFYLQTLYSGGFIAITLFVVILILMGKKLIVYKKSEFSNILSFAIFVILILMQNDSYLGIRTFYIIFVITYHMSDIIKQHEEYHQVKINNHYS